MMEPNEEGKRLFSEGIWTHVSIVSRQKKATVPRGPQTRMKWKKQTSAKLFCYNTRKEFEW